MSNKSYPDILNGYNTVHFVYQNVGCDLKDNVGFKEKKSHLSIFLLALKCVLVSHLNFLSKEIISILSVFKV